jgi:CRISPR-associated protein Cas1
MEPFRPFVDGIVYLSYTNGYSSLNTEIKSRLAGILTTDTVYGDCMRPLEIGLSATTSSLAKCVLGLSKSLALPQLE